MYSNRAQLEHQLTSKVISKSSEHYGLGDFQLKTLQTMSQEKPLSKGWEAGSFNDSFSSYLHRCLEEGLPQRLSWNSAPSFLHSDSGSGSSDQEARKGRRARRSGNHLQREKGKSDLRRREKTTRGEKSIGTYGKNGRNQSSVSYHKFDKTRWKTLDWFEKKIQPSWRWVELCGKLVQHNTHSASLICHPAFSHILFENVSP